jgi:L-histidine Nalpha-methyltransferase
MPEIDVHPSIANTSLEREVEASLRANALNPKLLYVTPRQTELWRQVFLKHSPIHGNPEFARIYRDAFARIAEERPPGKVWLVGLGCGTGLKERELCSQLKPHRHEVSFSAIDVSRDLVAESAKRLSGAGAKSERHLVCDLTEIDFLKQWLARMDTQTPRIFTFFGLVPNLTPKFVVQLLREILRPVDVILISVHLAPVRDDVDQAAAMEKVLPQYKNPETLAWLDAALEEWNLKEMVETPQMNIGEIEGMPAFVATARWKSDEPFERSDQRFSPNADEPLQLFHSLRYTQPLFEQLLRSAGFNVELLTQTACREEAIWSITMQL